MSFTLKVELGFSAYSVDSEDAWEATIEIDAESTLEDLHYVIQQAVEFDDDHLYEFFIARTERSRDKIRFDDENEKIFDTTLSSIFPLEKGRKLFYLFDYGDHWLFRVSKKRNASKELVKTDKLPRLIEEKGKKPEQYPEWEE